MTKVKTIAGILIVFILGAITGALAVQFYSKMETGRSYRRMSTEERVEKIMKHLSADLDLSERQQNEIRPIVAATEQKVRSVRDMYAPKIKALHDSSIQEIKTKLTPDQQAELDRKYAEWKERRGRRQKDRRQRSEVRGQRSEVRDQRSEVRDQRSEVRDKMSPAAG